ncbi:MAG: hypothetical protein CBE24_01250 [bacterium TMED264]|nr:cell division ATP-binding protein FtsE [Candidatus Neomarinimicrobiota bacterium]OUX34231.1 MAG: hypothetical protein CBE24_01250 [bacterium TMED264]|tara:strand:+ start:390 stop:1073 length:684 start_codon:yes stop_codon:yes gene_type:complete
MKNSSNKIIVFDNVSATYKNGVGIFNISFELDKSEFVFLMGPTGSGKSTILRSIYMDVFINKGNILYNGRNLSKIRKRQVPKLRRNIGMIFQDYKLLEDRTVYDNVALPLQIAGQKSNLIKKKVSEMLDRVGILDKYNSQPSKLSGGERQRVSIARALVKAPDLILADEPTGNLDPIIADEIIDLLEELSNSVGTAILMSTHNFPLIRPRQKRFIEIDQGKQIIHDI